MALESESKKIRDASWALGPVFHSWSRVWALEHSCTVFLLFNYEILNNLISEISYIPSSEHEQ